MAITTATVGAPLDNARRDLSDATEAMAAYWGRWISDTDGQMPDVARCRGSDHSRYVLTDAGRPALAMAALFDPGPILADVIATPCPPGIWQALHQCTEIQQLAKVCADPLDQTLGPVERVF